MQSYLIRIPPESRNTAAAFEGLFTNLHQILGRHRIAFEVIARGQHIGLFFTAPAEVAGAVSGQLYAVAPGVEIRELAPGELELPAAGVALRAAQLYLGRNSLYPLKRYAEFDGDSLSGIFSVLAQCGPQEEVWIQHVLTPVADTAWHNFRVTVQRRLERMTRRLSPRFWLKRRVRRELDRTIDAKLRQRLFRVSIRVLVVGRDTARLQGCFASVLNAFSSFNTLDENELQAVALNERQARELFQTRALSRAAMLSVAELATFIHLPNDREVPTVLAVLSRKEAPPRDLPTTEGDPEISFFGVATFRNQGVPFGIRVLDRRRHLYILGKSGTGKSKLLELLIRNDIEAGRGVAVLDPHGDLVDAILEFVPESRIGDVVLIDPSDVDFPVAFNPLEQVPEHLRIRVAIGFVEIFKRAFGANWTPRIEHLLRYTTLALLDSPHTTVLSIQKMLTDKKYRQGIVSGIQDSVVRSFWTSEFAAWSQHYDNEAITPLLNKVGQFVAPNVVRNIIGQPENRLNFRRIMDEQKILLMKFSKGVLGEESAALLGSMAVTKLYQAAMSRADIPESSRKDFFFYVDEFHNFATDSFDEILSEARKYHLNLTLANQFLGQLDQRTRQTIFGNVGSFITFRAGGEDAPIVTREFSPRFGERDIVNLGVREFCIKMSIDGEAKEAFSARTLDVLPPEKSFGSECRQQSRSNYARPLEEVREILRRWDEGRYAAGPARATAGKAADFEEPIF